MLPSGENAGDDEDLTQSLANIHPLVTSLLERNYIERNPMSRFVYDREEMIRLSTVPHSVNRPEHFLEEFNSEDGKFSPGKWMQHFWDQLDAERSLKKPSDSLKAETSYEDGAVLSPQRRGFSSGCCPPDERTLTSESNSSLRTKPSGSWTSNDSRIRWNEERKLLEDRKKNKSDGDEWRTSLRGRWRDSDEKSKDFKLPFQKSSEKQKTQSNSSTNSTWKSNNSQKDFRPAFGRAKDCGRSNNTEERLPEWVEDGPTTMDDVVELRGLDDPKRIKKKEKLSKMLPNKEGDLIQLMKKKGDALILNSLPETDAEFAAILGLCEDLPQPTVTRTQNDETGGTVSGSRLSRFFSKPSASILQEPESNVDGSIDNISQTMSILDRANKPVPSESLESQAKRLEKSILKELFGNSPSTSNEALVPPENAGHMEPHGSIKVSDLERKLLGENSERATSKVSTGEEGWAEKLRHLSLDGQTQWGENVQYGPHGSPHPRVTPPIAIPPEMLTGPVDGDLVPGLEWQHIPIENRYLMQHIYQKTLIEAANSRGCVPPPEIVDQIRQASILRVITPDFFYAHEGRQGTLPSTYQRQRSVAYPQAPLPEQATEQGYGSQMTTMIPASVARHMKTLNSQEKNQLLNMNPSTDNNFHAPEPPSELSGRRLGVQGTYQNVLGSTDGGYSMNTYPSNPPSAHYLPNMGPQQLMFQQPIDQLSVVHHHMMIAQAQQQQAQSVMMRQAQELLAQGRLHASESSSQRQIQPHELLAQQHFQQIRRPNSPINNQPHGLPNENFVPLHQNAPNHLERLLANAGIQPMNEMNKFPSSFHRLPSEARALTLEELERQLTRAKRED